MNQVILVGRLVKEPELEEIDGIAKCCITLAISRNYKNSEGIYETDFIKCTIWKGIAESTKEFCHKGDVIGVKGRLQNNNEVIAEKITFLSSNNKN